MKDKKTNLADELIEIYSNNKFVNLNDKFKDISIQDIEQVNILVIKSFAKQNSYQVFKNIFGYLNDVISLEKKDDYLFSLWFGYKTFIGFIDITEKEQCDFAYKITDSILNKNLTRFFSITFEEILFLIQVNQKMLYDERNKSTIDFKKYEESNFLFDKLIEHYISNENKKETNLKIIYKALLSSTEVDREYLLKKINEKMNLEELFNKYIILKKTNETEEEIVVNLFFNLHKENYEYYNEKFDEFNTSVLEMFANILKNHDYQIFKDIKVTKKFFHRNIIKNEIIVNDCISIKIQKGNENLLRDIAKIVVKEIVNKSIINDYSIEEKDIKILINKILRENQLFNMINETNYKNEKAKI